MPQNREFAPSLGALELSIDGAPVLCNVNISSYGINSALTNAMCFEDGGAVTNGQYLNGAVRPDQCSLIRRCFLGERYIYAHILVTGALDPALEVQQADRIVVFDRRTGTVVLSDTFQGNRPLKFATHLHCSGSISDLGDGVYRLTGGQANLIAGMKHGAKGLDDSERGEIYVQILQASPASQVVVEEPAWVPGYIYGLNNTGQEELSDGRFPRYRRWRLEAVERVKQGTFLVALSQRHEQVKFPDGAIGLPEGGITFGFGKREALGVTCEAEGLLWDEAAECVTAVGSISLQHDGGSLAFASPVDLEYCIRTGQGTAFSQSLRPPDIADGFSIKPWEPVGDESWRTHCTLRASFETNKGAAAVMEEQ